jgi:phosphinothricin acetyltransferase
VERLVDVADNVQQPDEVVGLHVLNLPATFEIEPPGRDEMARRYRAIAGNDYPYLVAERGREIVGYAYAGPYRPRPAYADTVENSVYVRAGLERGGVGQALMRALLAACEARDFRQMIAVIGDSANLPSIALHERLGFRSVGTLRAVGFKFGRWLDSVLMQRELGGGDRTVSRRGAGHAPTRPRTQTTGTASFRIG